MPPSSVESRFGEDPVNGAKELPPPNVVNLLGQRFHASVGIFYLGLGMLLCNVARDWISDTRNWTRPLALLLMTGGFAWWVVVWRRMRGRRPAS
jgi:hypothetical protein